MLSKATFLLLFYSFTKELAESANHFSVNTFSLDPCLLYLALNVNDGLPVIVSLVCCTLAT